VAGFFETAGPFDHLVLAASPGAVGSGPFADLTEDALRQAFDGKFFAHVKVLRSARPRLRADGSVTIVSAVAAASPAGRVGQPEDVAAAIVYLAGAGFVTGTVLECAGGANLTVGAVAS
jgi:NAD(P)-dependent dehydrogenase (short-subunit alcohol dehydrogenase family)